MVEQSTTSSTSTSSSSSSSGEVSKNWNTPISQLPNKLTATTFDDYVLIGKKGDNYAIYSNGDDSTTKSLFGSLTSQKQSELAD